MTLVDQLRLMVLTDAELLRGRDAVHVCRQAVAGGTTMVQVRAKDAAPHDVAALARALVAALSPAVPVIVNDRVDLALAVGAAGAHLGQDDVPPDRLRPHLPAGFILGASVGSPAEAERAGSWPVDYWSIGPCYATGNKPDAGTALGPEGFGRLARLAPPVMPVIGIGGINPGNAAAITAAGAVGIAVIAAVLGAPDPEAAARALRAAAASRSGSP